MIAQVAFLCAVLTAVSAGAYISAPIAYAKAPLPYAAVAKAPLAYTTLAKAPLAYAPLAYAPIAKPAPLAYAPVLKAPLAYSAPVISHRHVAYAAPHAVAHTPLAYSGLLGHSYYGHGLYAPHVAKVGYGKVLW